MFWTESRNIQQTQVCLGFLIYFTCVLWVANIENPHCFGEFYPFDEDGIESEVAFGQRSWCEWAAVKESLPQILLPMHHFSCGCWWPLSCSWCLGQIWPFWDTMTYMSKLRFLKRGDTSPFEAILHGIAGLLHCTELHWYCRNDLEWQRKCWAEWKPENISAELSILVQPL